jgi:hypothetical protein
MQGDRLSRTQSAKASEFLRGQDKRVADESNARTSFH